MVKPSNTKGTRDFTPLVMTKRSFIFDTIREVFVKYGYECIETPSLENRSTLTGKYGEEGDKLMFNVLDNGDFSKKADFSKSLPEITSAISSRALRYDLTVPFARFVTQHRDKLVFPFKRFQIQPVWRADKPQKGRYREFYQCDADVVGSDSLLYEIEQIQIFDEVLSRLNIDHVIHVNNRKILEGIAELSGQKDKLVDITVALDKMDKIGASGVINEFVKRGLREDSIEKIKPLFEINGSWHEKIDAIEKLLVNSEVGLKGVEEVRFVLSQVEELGLEKGIVEFNLTLARGLNYYTGAIFEVTTDMIKIGSICGGGRYDNLTALFGMSGTSGVGISFGADRIYDVMEEAQLWPAYLSKGLDVLFIYFGEEEAKAALKMLKLLRVNNVSCDIYPGPLKIPKQMKYANQKNVRFVAMMGSEEIEKEEVKLKDMNSGEEILLAKDELVSKMSCDQQFMDS